MSAQRWYQGVPMRTAGGRTINIISPSFRYKEEGMNNIQWDYVTSFERIDKIFKSPHQIAVLCMNIADSFATRLNRLGCRTEEMHDVLFKAASEWFCGHVVRGAWKMKNDTADLAFKLNGREVINWSELRRHLALVADEWVAINTGHRVAPYMSVHQALVSGTTLFLRP